MAEAATAANRLTINIIIPIPTILHHLPITIYTTMIVVINILITATMVFKKAIQPLAAVNMDSLVRQVSQVQEVFTVTHLLFHLHTILIACPMVTMTMDLLLMQQLHIMLTQIFTAGVLIPQL